MLVILRSPKEFKQWIKLPKTHTIKYHNFFRLYIDSEAYNNYFYLLEISNEKRELSIKEKDTGKLIKIYEDDMFFLNLSMEFFKKWSNFIDNLEYLIDKLVYKRLVKKDDKNGNN